MSGAIEFGLKVAVIGATGAVGRVLLEILEERKFPVGELLPFSSSRSEGKEIRFAGKSYSCQVMKKGCFKGVDLAFFDAADAISKEWVPEAAECGTWVVDNSATYRMESDALLLIPEVNGELLEKRLKDVSALRPRERILSGPNCSTSQMVLALKPLQDRWGLKRVVVSTYQSTSGAGASAMEELANQTRHVLNGEKSPLAPKAFSHPIAFNCIPHIGGFKESGYTSEEEKMIQETRKLLGLPDLKITATTVRVPTFSCHAESVNIECERPFDLDEVKSALAKQPGVVVQDDPASALYPMGEGAAGRDPVFVGRIRRDHSVDNGLNLWVVSDNLRKGAALNAVQIGERLIPSLRSARR